MEWYLELGHDWWAQKISYCVTSRKLYFYPVPQSINPVLRLWWWWYMWSCDTCVIIYWCGWSFLAGKKKKKKKNSLFFSSPPQCLAIIYFLLYNIYAVFSYVERNKCYMTFKSHLRLFGSLSDTYTVIAIATSLSRIIFLGRGLRVFKERGWPKFVLKGTKIGWFDTWKKIVGWGGFSPLKASPWIY